MKELKQQLRLYFAEIFMRWAFWIAPLDHEEGQDIIVTIGNHFKSKVK